MYSYYTELYHGSWIVRHVDEKSFRFGHFATEGDAYFIAQMLESGVLTFKAGDENGEEDA